MNLFVTYNLFPEVPKDEKVFEFIGYFIDFPGFCLLIVKV